MLHSVSWSEYATVVLIATILYYLFIWIVVFKCKLALLPGISRLNSISLTTAEDSPDEVAITAQHVMDDLRHLFQRGANQNELLYALKKKISKYKDWDEKGFREMINQFIRQECETKCSIRLGEDDLVTLWK